VWRCASRRRAADVTMCATPVLNPCTLPPLPHPGSHHPSRLRDRCGLALRFHLTVVHHRHRRQQSPRCRAPHPLQHRQHHQAAPRLHPLHRLAPPQQVEPVQPRPPRQGQRLRPWSRRRGWTCARLSSCCACPLPSPALRLLPPPKCPSGTSPSTPTPCERDPVCVTACVSVCDPCLKPIHPPTVAPPWLTPPRPLARPVRARPALPPHRHSPPTPPPAEPPVSSAPPAAAPAATAPPGSPPAPCV
jgi:hypothetical protein